jgi:hypothetical protein
MSELLNLLDSTIDDLADLEKFTPVPAGTHKFQIEFKETDSEDYIEIRMGLKVLETIEMKDKSQEPPEPGKETSQLFRLANKDGTPIVSEKTGKAMTFGQGQLKEILVQLQPTFGGSTLKEVMENANGGTVIATVGVRPNKNDPDQLFNTIRAVMVAD